METSGLSFAARYGNVRCIFCCALQKCLVYQLLLVNGNRLVYIYIWGKNLDFFVFVFAARYWNIWYSFCCMLWKRLVWLLLHAMETSGIAFVACYGNVWYSFCCMLWKRLVYLRCWLWTCLVRLFSGDYGKLLWIYYTCLFSLRVKKRYDVHYTVRYKQSGVIFDSRSRKCEPLICPTGETLSWSAWRHGIESRAKIHGLTMDLYIYTTLMTYIGI